MFIVQIDFMIIIAKEILGLTSTAAFANIDEDKFCLATIPGL